MAQPLFRPPGDDLAGYLTRYPQEVSFGDEEPAAVFRRYHTDDFVLRNDGIDLDRDRLLAHVRSGRRNVEEINVEVHQTLTSGSRVAGRYTLTAVMRRGQVIATEIYMFGEVTADGRLHRVEQLSRDVSAKQPAH
ncbi:nuclear transport factor 2 family protein [Actinoplanes sp. NPDC051411]|uniref:nuclear transport factor 2 family protein n=1 Tax=Actinoplanes sp. NPDC051411 TaxID=3155522 RepID=UPI00342313CD